MDDQDNEGESLLDRLRGTGVGVEDPNIVGDVGPTDIPPGRDPDTEGSLFADPPVPIDPAHDVEYVVVDSGEAGAAAPPVDSIEPPDLLAPPG